MSALRLPAAAQHTKQRVLGKTSRQTETNKAHSHDPYPFPFSVSRCQQLCTAPRAAEQVLPREGSSSSKR